MAITQALADSFKKSLLDGDMDFRSGSGDTFKLALYTSDATLNASTTAYSTTEEIPASGQYSAGGGTLVNAGTSVATSTAIVDFQDLSFTGVTLNTRGALIYNSSSAVTTNAAVAVLDFGSDKSVTAGTFTIQFPAFTTAAAIIRIA
jgi:hypothetical protein